MIKIFLTELCQCIFSIWLNKVKNKHKNNMLVITVAGYAKAYLKILPYLAQAFLKLPLQCD